jgi:hypothetical protein
MKLFARNLLRLIRMLTRECEGTQARLSYAGAKNAPLMADID